MKFDEGQEREKNLSYSDSSRLHPVPLETLRDSTRRGMATVVVGVVASTLLAGVKIMAGIWGRSNALIADGIESAADVVSSLLVWGSLKIASRPPDDNHPYGHGKAESLAALAISLVLLGAALLIVYQSLQGILYAHKTPAPFTLAVLAGVIVTKEILFRFFLHTGREVESGALETDAWHHRLDALTSLAAFVGISLAIWGGKGYESADDWAALVACGIIVFNAYFLFRNALDEIMDATVDSEFIEKVRQTAREVEGVEDIEKCRVRKSGLMYVVDIHVEVDGDLTVRRGHDIAHQVQDALFQSPYNIIEVLVHIEPAGIHREISSARQ